MQIRMKQGEAKVLRFDVTAGGVAADCSAAVATFTVKAQNGDDEVVFTKLEEHLDLAAAAAGIIRVPLLKEDTNIEPGLYVGELRLFFSEQSIDKSEDIYIEITRAVA